MWGGCGGDGSEKGGGVRRCAVFRERSGCRFARRREGVCELEMCGEGGPLGSSVGQSAVVGDGGKTLCSLLRASWDVSSLTEGR